MLNRNEIALSLLPSLISTAGNDNTLVVGHAFEIADEYIEAVNMSKETAENNGGWISVEDRLPEDGQPVIVSNTAQGVIVAWIVDEKRWRNHLYQINGVTHWQPLPSSPKGETE